MEQNTTSNEETIGGTIDPEKMPGHWILARMGKRILRPGGRRLTNLMLTSLKITESDDVVEFAPGLGITSAQVVALQPKSYVGVEREEKAAEHVSAMLPSAKYRCIVGTAQRSGLPDASASVVFGEAFLTMQSPLHKQAIANEAFRILRPGGRYGLHELSLRPDTLPLTQQKAIHDALSRPVRVGARPISVAEWRRILEHAGFDVHAQYTAPMGLLHPRQFVRDEGVVGTLRVLLNLLRNRVARRRVLTMRSTFRTHADHLGSVVLVARKPE